MPITLNDVYAKELELKNHYRVATNTADDINKSYILKSEITTYLCELCKYKLPNKSEINLDGFYDIQIPTEVLQKSSDMAMSGNISNIDATKLSDFFAKLDINIDNIEIIQVASLPNKAEGFAIACGPDQHYVCIPKITSEAFLSYDLLVHEIGHTVEFSHRREDEDLSRILTYPIFSEAIAHYYQIIYMLNESTQQERLGMIASFTNAYFFLHCMKIMRKIDPKSKRFDFAKITRHIDFKEFIDAYASKKNRLLDFLINEIDNQEIEPIFYEHHAKRLGVFIAFNMIKYNFNITELMDVKIPSGNTDLTKLIAQTSIKPKVLLNFKNMGKTIESFVDGSLKNNLPAL